MLNRSETDEKTPTGPLLTGEDTVSEAPFGPAERNEMINRLWRVASQELERIEAELAAPAHADPANREKTARAMAYVSLALRDIAALGGDEDLETTFFDDDPRACPRDPALFKLAIANELDRQRERKAASGT